MLIGQQLNYNSLVLAFGNSIHNVIVIDLFSVHSVHIQSGVQLVHNYVKHSGPVYYASPN